MKLFSLVIATSCLAASAFGVTPVSKNIAKATSSGALKSPLRKDTAFESPLFREASATRGGAVPGWAAYNDSLDKSPLTTKAFTSLVGWALGDVLAQVRLFTMEIDGDNTKIAYTAGSDILKLACCACAGRLDLVKSIRIILTTMRRHWKNVSLRFTRSCILPRLPTVPVAVATIQLTLSISSLNTFST